MNSGAEAFGPEYFKFRVGNDPLRQRSFQQEKAWLERRLGQDIFRAGRLLDVGCSTGEFIEALGWDRASAFGMEISEHARHVALEKGIRFDRDLFNSCGFFDLIVYRGTVQYLPNPFHYIARSFAALRPGGHIVFLATPNTGSFYYRHFGTLPFLEEPLNFWLPCHGSLRMVLRNCGFEAIEMRFPYWNTPYAKPLRDHWRCLCKLLLRTNQRFPFWGSSMWSMARRPDKPAS